MIINLKSKLQLEIIRLKENNNFTNIEIAEDLNCDYSYVCAVLKLYREKDLSISNDDYEGQLLIKAAGLEKQKQKLQDNQRVERKIREQIRNENSVVALTEELIEIFKNRKPNRTIRHETNNKNSIGIFHITDTHFNELINIKSNQYDFKIAAKRLKKMVIEAKRVFRSYKIKTVLIAFTGDLLNSDRRLDELLNECTNRANACALGAILLEQVILDLNKDFNLKIAYVAGNEGRVNQEMGSTEIMMSDNYDITIISMLKLMFRGTDINFIENSVVENVVQLNGKNILLIHGHQVKKSIQNSLQKIRGKYSDMDIKLDFILFGHLHSCHIGDLYARGSSLCGANAYSNSDLQLSSKASQNIHIVTDNEINSMKIDLQNTENIIGYNIDEDLEAYNAKSIEKIVWMRPKKI